jgi:RNA polymerase sigma-70 factor (ECF subfamily)
VGRLFDAHGASLYRYALMVLADPAAAEDAVQQVFSGLLRPAVGIEVDDERRYLRRAVRNACYSALRRRRVRGEDEPLSALLEPVSGERPLEERLALERAIRELPAEQREVVHLHVFEGLTFREIAEQCGDSINTVASRYRYAIERMRALLEGI